MLFWNMLDMNKELITDNNNYTQDELETYKELDQVLVNRDIKSVFQPIVSLFDGEIFGYEALSRGIPGS